MHARQWAEFALQRHSITGNSFHRNIHGQQQLVRRPNNDLNTNVTRFLKQQCANLGGACDILSAPQQRTTAVRVCHQRRFIAQRRATSACRAARARELRCEGRCECEHVWCGRVTY